jgi:chemotaxis protein CheC
VISLTELQQDAMVEFLNIGMGRAASVLSEMMGEEVLLSIPFVDLMSCHDAAGFIMEKACDRIIAVLQKFSGLCWGDTMLVFPEEKSLELVRSLFKDTDTTPLKVMTDMEQEALMEIGNIILNACIGSISDILHIDVSSTLPSLLCGSCEEILGTKDSPPTDDEVVMLLRMDFALYERSMQGGVVFVMNGSAIPELREKIDQLLSDL